MSKYRLTIIEEFEAPDDPMARKMARGKLRALAFSYVLNGPEPKLQVIYPNKPPRKVNLGDI